jgi:hypothetical protein
MAGAPWLSPLPPPQEPTNTDRYVLIAEIVATMDALPLRPRLWPPESIRRPAALRNDGVRHGRVLIAPSALSAIASGRPPYAASRSSRSVARGSGTV